ncbi:MAG: hypothetical protein ABIP21_12470, partial [Acidimicrobiia bacterium]
MLGSFRLAALLATREARHRPARTALVVLLVAIPVFAITTTDVLVRAGIDSQLGRYQRAHGATDVAFFVDAQRARGNAVPRRLVPAGTHVLRFRTASLPLTPAVEALGT